MGTLHLEQVYSVETQLYRVQPRIWRDWEIFSMERDDSAAG